MKKSALLEVIDSSLENRIIDFLIEGVGIDYTKKDIADGCSISRPTFYKAFPNLLKAKIIKATRMIGRVQLYTINTENEKVKALLKLEEFLLKKSFEEVEIKAKVKV